MFLLRIFKILNTFNITWITHTSFSLNIWMDMIIFDIRWIKRTNCTYKRGMVQENWTTWLNTIIVPPHKWPHKLQHSHTHKDEYFLDTTIHTLSNLYKVCNNLLRKKQDKTKQEKINFFKYNVVPPNMLQSCLECVYGPLNIMYTCFSFLQFTLNVFSLPFPSPPLPFFNKLVITQPNRQHTLSPITTLLSCIKIVIQALHKYQMQVFYIPIIFDHNLTSKTN